MLQTYINHLSQSTREFVVFTQAKIGVMTVILYHKNELYLIMQFYSLEKDISVFCVTASSFPEGVLAAHQKLHSYVSFNENRNYFGISAPDKTGTIVYKSAAEEMEPSELSKHNLEPFVIKKGSYSYIDIRDFEKNIPAIKKAFDELITNPDIDPQGCCVEWYLKSNLVRCMIRLKDIN
ncbi:MAG: transcriptional regulator [Bacteroidota bacterium]